MPEPPLLTVAQVAERLACSPAATYDLLKRGELPAVRIPGRKKRPMLRVKPDDLDRFIDGWRK